MRGAGRFSAARTMAVQELIEWPLDFERDLAAQATPPECRHSCFLTDMDLSRSRTAARIDVRAMK